jgi:hypothetical protein
LRAKSGLLFTAFYLKECRVALKRHYADSFELNAPLSVAVSLTRSGLPPIIPRKIRQKILRRDDAAHTLVQIYNSWFGLGPLIRLAPKVSKNTFSSITTPSHGWDAWYKDLGVESQSPKVEPEPVTPPPVKKTVWKPDLYAEPMSERTYQILKSWGALCVRVNLDWLSPFFPPTMWVGLRGRSIILTFRDIPSSPGGFVIVQLFALSIGFLWYIESILGFSGLDLDYTREVVSPWWTTLPFVVFGVQSEKALASADSNSSLRSGMYVLVVPLCSCADYCVLVTLPPPGIFWLEAEGDSQVNVLLCSYSISFDSTDLDLISSVNRIVTAIYYCHYDSDSCHVVWVR